MTRARDTASIFAADGSLNISTSVNLGDNEKAYFGTSNDLQIYHDGSNSWIRDTGTGNLYIQGSSAIHLRGENSEFLASFGENSATTLYYDGSAKLATTSGGIDVTGTVTADDNVTIAGTNPKVTLTDTDGPYESRILQTGSNTEIKNDNGGNIRFFTGSNGEVLRLAPGYDVQIYDGAGTNYAIFDASTQRLGLGTTTPDEKLEIAGNLKLSDSSPEITFETGASHYNWQIAAQEYTSQSLQIGLGSQDADASNDTFSPVMTINSGGNVGIGITSPSGILNVHNASGDANMFITTGTTNGSTTLFFGDSLNSTRGRLQYDHSNDSMRFQTAAAEAMRIDSSGNVGIGTTNPLSSLHIDAANGAENFIRLHDGNSSYGYAMGLGSNGDYIISKYDGGSAVEALRVKRTNGNVGIGTTSPSTPLNVKTHSGTWEVCQLQNTYGTSAALIRAIGAAGGSVDFGCAGNSASTAILRTNGTERMRIDASGRVTMPYQPSCYVYGTNTQTISSGDNYHLCQMGTEAHDIGNNFNTTTYRFTAPVDGVYIVYYRAVVYFVANTRVGIALRKNGTNLPTDPFETATGNFDYPRFGATKILELSANDYLTVHVNQYSGSNQTLTNKELHVALLG